MNSHWIESKGWKRFSIWYGRVALSFAGLVILSALVRTLVEVTR